MKVTEKGEPEKVWPRSHRTPCCDSLLELDASDIKTNRDYLGDFTGYYIDCIVCGEQPWVKETLGRSSERWLKNEHTAAILHAPEKAIPPPCQSHHEIQHRDAKPAWCDACGWRHGTPGTSAVLLNQHASARLQGKIRSMSRTPPSGRFPHEEPPFVKGVEEEECSVCGQVGGPWPQGDRPASAWPLQSGCSRCGWCY